MQLRRVRVQNIQSIEDMVLEFSPGMTAIVGANESGKSAFIRAILVCLTNSDSKFEVRKHAKRCEVELFFDDGSEKGLSILWKRQQGASSATVSYRVNDQEYTRMGRNVPEKVRELAFPWKVGPENFGFVQIQEQNSPPFLTMTMSAAAGRAWDLLEGKEFRAILDSCKSSIKKEVSVQTQCLEKLNFYSDFVDLRLDALDDLFISSQKSLRSARILFSLLLRKKLQSIECLQLQILEIFAVLVVKLRERVDVSTLLKSLKVLYFLTEVTELKSTFKKNSKKFDLKLQELEECDQDLKGSLDCPFYRETGDCILLKGLLGEVS